MLTSQTCVHDAPAGRAPASPVPHREHSAGGSAVFRWSGSGSRARPAPGWPGCPPGLRSWRRSRSEEFRLVRSALRRSLAPDAVLRRRRPGISTVLPEPAFQLRDPQLHPAAQLPLGRQLRPQHHDLGVLRLDHSPQPGQQLTLLPGTSRQIRHIGHEPRSCSTPAAGSSFAHVVSRLRLPAGTPPWPCRRADACTASASSKTSSLRAVRQAWNSRRNRASTAAGRAPASSGKLSITAFVHDLCPLREQMIMRRPYSRTTTRRAHRLKIREKPRPQPSRLKNKLSLPHPGVWLPRRENGGCWSWRAEVRSLPRGGRGWVMWLRSGCRMVQVGCGLPVTPSFFGIRARS